MAAGNVAAAAVAQSSTSDSPLPQPISSQQDLAAKSPALPAPTPQSSSAISMTAALKNVGAVSIDLQRKQYCLSMYFEATINFAFCVWQITPLKESLPDLETAAVIQVSVWVVSVLTS